MKVTSKRDRDKREEEVGVAVPPWPPTGSCQF